MLIETASHVGFGLALLDGVFKAPSAEEISHIAMRWLHFVAGITWIGLLYFFNLVNVPLQKKLDPETKKKVNPDLLLPALWYFRWGALLTVLAGLGYYAMYILKANVHNANLAGGHVNGWVLLIVWLFIPIVTFLVEFLIIKKVPALIKDGRVFAIVALILGGGHGNRHCEMDRFQFDGRHFHTGRQQLSIDWRWGCAGPDHAAQCLGHYLAGKQAHHRGFAGRAPCGARIGASGVHRFADKCPGCRYQCWF